MYWHPTIWRGLLVALEALLVALLATAVFNIAIFVIPFLGNGWGMAFALFNALRAGAVFLVFSPCLLLAAAIVAHLQASSFSIPRP